MFDQYVQPAKAIHGCRNELRGCTGLAQVHLDELSLSTVLPDVGHDSLTGGRLGTRDHDGIAPLGEHLGASFADTRS